MKPLISIITVSLNAAPTIEDTIMSVARQQKTFEIEHVCVDGGSRDATRHIIDLCVARGISIKRVYEPDRGIFDAMNKGLRAAQGDYVLFLNADDFLVEEGTLAAAMSGLASGAAQNPDLVLGDVAMGNLGKFGIWRHRRVPTLLGRWRGWGLFPVHQGQFTKRRLLDDIGGFNTDLRVSSDVIQFYDLEQKFHPSIRFLRTDVAFMRLGGASNEGLCVMYSATAEFYKHLRSVHSRWRATAIVVIKTLQSLVELRVGRCRHHRWFVASSPVPAVTAKDA